MPEKARLWFDIEESAITAMRSVRTLYPFCTASKSYLLARRAQAACPPRLHHYREAAFAAARKKSLFGELFEAEL